MRTAGVAYEGDYDSVKEVFKQYEKLTKKSGLVLNADKTKIISLHTDRIITHDVMG